MQVFKNSNKLIFRKYILKRIYQNSYKYVFHKSIKNHNQSLTLKFVNSIKKKNNIPIFYTKKPWITQQIFQPITEWWILRVTNNRSPWQWSFFVFLFLFHFHFHFPTLKGQKSLLSKQRTCLQFHSNLNSLCDLPFNKEKWQFNGL